MGDRAELFKTGPAVLITLDGLARLHDGLLPHAAWSLFPEVKNEPLHIKSNRCNAGTAIGLVRIIVSPCSLLPLAGFFAAVGSSEGVW